MERSKKHSLAMGLIGHKSGLVYAQMQIYLRDHKIVGFKIRRKPYSNLPDIEFSVDNRDLQEIVGILNEAKKKLDAYWISRLATTELIGWQSANIRVQKTPTHTDSLLL